MPERSGTFLAPRRGPTGAAALAWRALPPPCLPAAARASQHLSLRSPQPELCAGSQGPGERPAGTPGPRLHRPSPWEAWLPILTVLFIFHVNSNFQILTQLKQANGVSPVPRVCGRLGSVPHGVSPTCLCGDISPTIAACPAPTPSCSLLGGRAGRGAPPPAPQPLSVRTAPRVTGVGLWVLGAGGFPFGHLHSP